MREKSSNDCAKRRRPFSGAVRGASCRGRGRDCPGCSEEALREKWDALEAAGATELFYSPAGPDIPRELRAMARAVGASA